MSPEMVATVYAAFAARYTTMASPPTSSFELAAIVMWGGAAWVVATAAGIPAPSKLPATAQTAAIRQSFDTRTYLSRPGNGRGSAFRTVQRLGPASTVGHNFGVCPPDGQVHPTRCTLNRVMTPWLTV